MTSPRPAVTAFASALSLCLLAVAACSGGTSKRLIPPPPSVASITTAPPGSDYSGVALPIVEGRAPVEKVAVTGGDSTLSGLITGPDGPVGGATVRLERFVGDAIGFIDILSNADGTWRAPQIAPPTTFAPVPQQPLPLGQLPTIPPATAGPPPTPTTKPVGPQGILGGRYRVRAWKTPDLALTAPQILFLESRQNRQLGLQVSRYTGTSASSVSSPDPPFLGEPVTVTAVVSSLSVNGEGIVSSVPLPGAAVSLSVGGGLLLTSGATTTNGQGRAAFQLRCEQLGPGLVELTVNSSQTFTLPLRPCVARPTTTTSSTLFPDPGASTSSTSSIPGGRPSSTIGGGVPTP